MFSTMPLMLLDTVGICLESRQRDTGREYFIMLARAGELKVKR